MTVMEEVLLEEYERSLRLSAALESELSGLPRGSVRERKVDSGTYYYLQYREGSHVRSEYVAREDVEGVRRLVERRREVMSALREQKRTRTQIERALGRRFLDEHAGA